MSSRTPQELAPRIWDAWRGARLEMLTTPPSQAERQLDALIKELLRSVRDVPSPAAAEDDKASFDHYWQTYHGSGTEDERQRAWKVWRWAVRSARSEDATVAGLVAALEPFAAIDVDNMARGADPRTVYLWKRQSNVREEQGISVADIDRARAALAAHRNARGEEDAD